MVTKKAIAKGQQGIVPAALSKPVGPYSLPGCPLTGIFMPVMFITVVLEAVSGSGAIWRVMNFYVGGKRSWLGICGKNRVKKDFDEVRLARCYLRKRLEIIRGE